MKFIPLSLVIMTIVLPSLMAQKPQPQKSIRFVHMTMAAFILVWGFLCLYVYTRYVFVQ